MYNINIIYDNYTILIYIDVDVVLVFSFPLQYINDLLLWLEAPDNVARGPPLGKLQASRPLFNWKDLLFKGALDSRRRAFGTMAGHLRTVGHGAQVMPMGPALTQAVVPDVIREKYAKFWPRSPKTLRFRRVFGRESDVK